MEWRPRRRWSCGRRRALIGPRGGGRRLHWRRGSERSAVQEEEAREESILLTWPRALELLPRGSAVSKSLLFININNFVSAENFEIVDVDVKRKTKIPMYSERR